MDTKLNINSIEAGSITYDKFNQDVVDKFNNKADSASVTNVSNRVTAIEGLIATDSDAVIDKWDEVVTFLDGISATDDLEGILANKANTSTVNDLLNGKLDKTGGTINSTGVNPLNINTTNESEVGIYFHQNNTSKAWVGHSASGGTGIYDVATNSTLGITIGGVPHFNKKTLLHSGNVGEYTAGAAKKLETAVSLWGNEFDGTQSLNGNIYMDNSRELCGKNTDNKNVSLVTINSNNNILLAPSSISYNMSTYLYGTSIEFRTGSNYTTAMTITDGGNIEIAGANNVYTRKLAVGIGGTHIISTTTGVPALGTPAANSLLVGSVHYGLQISTDTNSEASFIQAQRFDSVDAKTLNLNPLGGAVNVGEGGLNVNSSIISTGSLSLGTEDVEGSIYLRRKTHNYLWASSEGGSISIGVQDIGGAGVATASLQILPYSLNPGTRNNAVSLGTSSYRWSNVYSVNGNFSGRVLIGTSIDDGNFKLNVAGAVKITRSNDVGTYLGITVSDILTTFNALDGTDNYMRYSFQSHGTELLRLDGKEGGTSYFRTLVGFDKKATFNAGALIPTGQKLTIGDAVLEYDGGLKSSHNFVGNLTGTATKVSNALTFGSKTFDGSSEQTITATDLGVTSSTISEWGFTKNAGTVTSVATGTGLTGGTITGIGTISLDSTYQTYCTNGNAAWASYTTATSIASIPVGYKLVKCTISASGSFALASTSITAGREIHIIIYNSSSSDVVVSLPTAAPYVNFSADSLTVPANRYAEINVISDGSNLYIRTLA